MFINEMSTFMGIVAIILVLSLLVELSAGRISSTYSRRLRLSPTVYSLGYEVSSRVEKYARWPVTITLFVIVVDASMRHQWRVAIIFAICLIVHSSYIWFEEQLDENSPGAPVPEITKRERA